MWIVAHQLQHPQVLAAQCPVLSFTGCNCWRCLELKRLAAENCMQNWYCCFFEMYRVTHGSRTVFKKKITR